MARSKERLVARNLRKQGKSIKEISALTNVSVGSVSYWCRDIILTPEQILQLQNNKRNPFYGRRGEYLIKQREKLNEKIASLRKEGIKTVGNLSKREIFLVGIALYWGEGFKKDHQVGFATSDLYMAKFFIHWLEKCFNIKRENLLIRVTINNAYKHRIKLIEDYWCKELKISQDNLSKAFYQKVKWQKEYENKEDYHGVIRIRVRKSMDFLRKIFGYIEGLHRNISL